MPNNKFKNIDYQCVRCGYETNKKTNMARHFQSKQKMCPGAVNDIELTDEIKEHILTNRVFPVAKQNIIQNTVNNYNMLNNFINKMDIDRKISHVLDYQDKNLLEFEDNLETFFEGRKKRLEDRSFRAAYVLNQDDIIQLVDHVTKSDHTRLDLLNILFDKKLRRIKIFREGKWSSYLEEKGVQELVSLIKSYYLDDYEMYLIKNIHSENSKVVNKNTLKLHLEIYYHFLAIFDLPIYVFGQTDEEILGHRLLENNEYYLDDRYTGQYERHKNSIKESEKTRVKGKIIKIIKENTIHNMTELNNILLELLQKDEDFKSRLLKNAFVAK